MRITQNKRISNREPVKFLDRDAVRRIAASKKYSDAELSLNRVGGGNKSAKSPKARINLIRRVLAQMKKDGKIITAVDEVF